jgi:hypothetical protein
LTNTTLLDRVEESAGFSPKAFLMKGGAMASTAEYSFWKWVICVAIAASIGSFQTVSAATDPEKPAPGREMARQATRGKQLWITADHTKFEVLKQAFTAGPEVTRACLGCHSEAALQFHKTIHWTWKDPNSRDNDRLGKGGLSVNNF